MGKDKKMPSKAAKVETKLYVSLCQVTKFLEQRRDVFKELFQQQQENFKRFVKIVLESTNTRMDAVAK